MIATAEFLRNGAASGDAESSAGTIPEQGPGGKEVNSLYT